MVPSEDIAQFAAPFFINIKLLLPSIINVVTFWHIAESIVISQHCCLRVLSENTLQELTLNSCRYNKESFAWLIWLKSNCISFQNMSARFSFYQTTNLTIKCCITFNLSAVSFYYVTISFPLIWPRLKEIVGKIKMLDICNDSPIYNAYLNH